MTPEQIAYLHFIIDQANTADMDIGISSNVLATLLAAHEKATAERATLLAACEGARALIRIIDAANPGGFSVGAVLLTLDQALADTSACGDGVNTMYQVGRAERIEIDDPRFDTEADAIAHAQKEATDDQVWAVWKWTSEDWADVVCLIYQDAVYTA